MTDIDKLYQFCSAYFHQDWDLDSSTTDDVVDAYIKSGPAVAEVEEITRQIRTFVDMYGSDRELEEALLPRLGCYYLPSADAQSARGWLLDVADRLERRST